MKTKKTKTAATKTVRVHFVNSAKHGVCVHRVGCADVARAVKTGDAQSDWQEDLDVTSRTVAAAATAAMNSSFGWAEGDADDAPWSENDIRFLPCLRSVS